MTTQRFGLVRLEPGDPRIPQRRAEALGLSPDADHRRPLWVEGQLGAFALPAVGIVGTRRPSAHGLAAARSLAGAAAAAGWAIVSGAALGIDAAAHAAALALDGVTIAVLPSPPPLGLRRGAAALAAQIPRRGAFVADQPPGTPPARWSFAARNALLAGLCDALVVVEAPLGSGALITAEAAVERGVPVALVTSPFAAESACGGWQWYRGEIELSVRYPERRPPALLSDRTSLFSWLGDLGASVREDSATTPSTHVVAPAGSLQARILDAIAAAGSVGLAEGDLLRVRTVDAHALPAALSLLALGGHIEQRAGRWRLSEGGVLRSRA